MQVLVVSLMMVVTLKITVVYIPYCLFTVYACNISLRCLGFVTVQTANIKVFCGVCFVVW
jgi:hypothetical protein